MTELIDWARLSAQGGLTVDDLPDEHASQARLELVDGSLIVTPLGDYNHQLLIAQMIIQLSGHLPSGFVALPGVNVVHGQRTLLIPDLAVIDPALVVPSGLGVAPEGVRLAIEITSPSTRVHDLTTKRNLYGDWHVPYLIIDRSGTSLLARVYGDLPDYARVLIADMRVE